MLRQVPGFSLFRRTTSRAANPTTQGVSLRGLGASGASRALVLSDGFPLNDPFGGWVYWDRAPAGKHCEHRGGQRRRLASLRVRCPWRGDQRYSHAHKSGLHFARSGVRQRKLARPLAHRQQKFGTMVDRHRFRAFPHRWLYRGPRGPKRRRRHFRKLARCDRRRHRSAAIWGSRECFCPGIGFWRVTA